MTASILVTGATGKTGAELITLLERAEVPFSGGVRQIDPDRGYPQVEFDWQRPETWAQALMGVESLYLVKPHHDAVAAFGELLASAPYLRRVVLLSELGREAKPDADPERAIELVVENGASAWTILRPSWFFQNFNGAGGFGESIRTSGELRLPIGDGRLSLIDTRDVAEAAFVALTTDDHAGSGLDLTGPQAFTMSEVAEAISGATGRDVVHRDSALAAYRSELVDAGSDVYVVDYLMDLMTDARNDRYAGITHDLEKVTGRPPRTLADFVAENVDYWSGGPA
ncbi:NAD(P)H-binding protein [Aeromicrobium panaciterrae]|uniref:hypothetical protein n=1 Tax=Aeromicrobium panaciterrae TaxID=363861 RepID=UPI0031D44237